MRLSINEYIWLLSDDIFVNITDSEEAKYHAIWYEDHKKAEEYLNSLQKLYEKKYSYMKAINLKYKMIYCDLERSVITWRAVIKYNDKYYSFIWYDSPFWDYKEMLENADLVEVYPHKVTITEYNIHETNQSELSNN